MPEFRIEGDALRREARLRLLSWATVLLLLAASVLLFTLGFSGRLRAHPSIRLLFPFTCNGTVIGAAIVAFREALHLAERQMVFVLNDKEIVRKRKGFPDVKIAFSEIEILSEGRRYLVIKTAKPEKKIAIRNDVSGYDTIRAELAKHHPVSVPAPASVGPLLRTFGLLAVAILSWIAVARFRGVVVIVPGVVGLTTVAIGTYRMWTLLNRRLWRPLVWAAIGSAWLLAFFLIYLGVVRP